MERRITHRFEFDREEVLRALMEYLRSLDVPVPDSYSVVEIASHGAGGASVTWTEIDDYQQQIKLSPAERLAALSARRARGRSVLPEDGAAERQK